MRIAKSSAFAVVVVAAALTTACTDRRPDRATPTGPQRATGPAAAGVMGVCTTIGQLNTLAEAVFGAGSPNVNSVLGKLDNLRKKVEANNTADAQAQAMNIVTFVRDKAEQGTLPGTQAQITAFISGVLCYAGLSPDTFLILPTDSPQIRVASDNLSGISLQANTVSVPTLLTIATLDPSAGSPLDTKLDQYATYTEITASSELTKPAIVAVCPTGVIPTDVRARLRLGHQAATGFEVTPAADGGFLTCTASTAQSGLSRFLHSLASLVVPKPLYARVREFGGVGGSVTELSPFGAVDPELSFAGGVGGSVTELHRAPAPTDSIRVREPSKRPRTSTSSPVPPSLLTPRAQANAVSATGDCTEMSATVGTGLDPACRPHVRLTTRNGTILIGVPVNWAVTGGGGSIAPVAVATQACGAYATTAATATDSAGRAGICWTMGPEGGENTTVAVPAAGGDAPAGVSFNPPSIAFTAIALKITPGVTATGGTFTYNAAPVTGSGACSNDLAPQLSYSSGSAPTDVGSYTLTVTCGGGNVFNVATATATITITPAPTTTTVSCSPSSLEFDGTPKTPCSATVSGPGTPGGAPTLAYENNTNAGTASVTATYAGAGNWLGSTATATFEITRAPSAVTVTCTGTPTYDGTPQTPCSAAATGAGGLNAPLPVTYSNNVSAGVGTATASATFAGDANHTGNSNSAVFSIAKATSSIAITCTGTPTYNGAPQTPCSATATGAGGLNVPLPVDYSNNVGAGVNTATASAAYAGDANHTGSSGTVSFSIAKATATATAGNATINFGASVPTIPCTVTGLIAADAGSVTCTTSVPPITVAGTYPTTPVVSPANPANYAMTLVSGTLTVAAYVQVGCFAAPVYSVMPETKSAQRKGSNLPIKCTLRTPQGASVTTATGDIKVYDVGTSAVTPPARPDPTASPVFTGVNVFKYSNSGNYAYGLDTSPSAFVAGRYYYVYAIWNDGSKTEGWFLLK